MDRAGPCPAETARECRPARVKAAHRAVLTTIRRAIALRVHRCRILLAAMVILPFR